MGTASDHLFSVAPDDVAWTVRWLLEHGFAISSEAGGHGEVFGNVLVELDREEICCRIVRDRSQWTLDIALGDREFRWLAVYLTAMTGAPVAIPDPPDSSVPPASQLPVHVRWADTVPTVIDWLSTGSRSSVVETAAASWDTAMKAWWRRQRRAGSRRPPAGG